MKKSIVLLCLLTLVGGIMGCRSKEVEKLQKIEVMEIYTEYNPFRVEEGIFYFTTLEEEGIKVYAMDVKTKEINMLFSEIGQYDAFVPLGEDHAIYVDGEGNLFYKKGQDEIKIDTEISGMNSPNVLISPKRNGILYTKGTHENSSVYLYILEAEEPQLIKTSISEDAYTNFQFTTQWSNERNYFVFNNNEVYNDKGEKISSIEATSFKWAPDDKYIAYIQIPENLQQNKVIIGEWTTYIGERFVLHKIDDGEEVVILESAHDLIDPIDSIQWSWNDERIAIMESNVIKGEGDSLQKNQYQGVQVYHIPSKGLTKIDELKVNYYELLFNNFIYGKNLGENGPLEIYSFGKDKKKSFQEPLMLNNKDLFMISGKEKAYLINGNELIELDAEGGERSLLNLPWEPYFMFLDETNKSLIIINKDQEMYLYQL